ncbi:MAG: hypothetical protein ACR2JK_05865 [Geodermatophilaceae bacterium]
MTAPPRHAVAEPETRNGSLFRTEIARLRARRFIQLLVGLALIGFVVLSIVAFTQFSEPTPDVLADAQARLEQDIALSEQFREQCLADESIPEDEREFACGPPLDEQGFVVENYIDKRPFTLTDDLPAGSLGVAAATAMLGFVIGATYVGAEWSTRSIVALLFWETRRLKVIGVKTGVAVLAGAALGVVGQLLWLGASHVLVRTRGSTTAVPDGFWSDFSGQAGRGVLLAVVGTLFGFGLANLVRNTGAALGVGFAYFAIVESALRGFVPKSQPFLVSESAGALVEDGGLSLFVEGPTVDQGTGSFTEFTEMIVSNVRGGLTLAAYLLVLLAAGTWLFRRRDLH